MDNERIDFGSLDPARDSRRWEGLIESVTDRALANRTAREDRTISHQLVAWAQPFLAIAAAVALVIWTATLLTSSWPTLTDEEAEEQPAYQLATWAANGETPPALEILQVLGEGNGTD